MYRKHLEKMAEIEADQQFIERVSSLPIVTSTVGQVTSLYEKTKESNRLFKYTFEMGENVVKTAATTAKPVIDKLEPQLSVVNHYACQQLDKLEEKYPSLQKPTEKILEDGRQVYEKNLKPTVDAALAVKQYGVDTVVSVKDYGYEKIENAKKTAEDTVNGAKTFAANKVRDATAKGHEAVNLLLQSQYGKVLAVQAEGLLAVTEGYVEKYLPPAEGEEVQTEKESMDVDEAKPKELSVARVHTLSDKVRRRMFSRAMKDMQHVQKRSKETMENLNFTVDLIQYAKKNINNTTQKMTETAMATKDKLGEIWHEINREEEQSDEKVAEELTEKSLEHKTIQTARYLTLQLKRSLSTTSTAVQELPETIQGKLSNAKSYAEDMYKSFCEASTYQDLSSNLLEQAREHLANVQEALNSLTDYVLSTWPVTMVVAKPTAIIEEIEMEETPKVE